MKDDDARPAFPAAFSLESVSRGVAPWPRLPKWKSSCSKKFDDTKFSFVDFPLSSCLHYTVDCIILITLHYGCLRPQYFFAFFLIMFVQTFFLCSRIQCREAGCTQTVRGCRCFVLLLYSVRECSLSLPLPVTYGWDSSRDPSWATDTAAGAWHLASCKRGFWERRLQERWGVVGLEKVRERWGDV